MQLHEVAVDAYNQEVDALKSQEEKDCLLIAQGGADPLAQQGIQKLAFEINDWRCRHGVDPLHVVTPAGTGTTAFYLAKALPDAELLTTPSVGDKDYLMAQMSHLGEVPETLHIIENRKKHHFAKPYPELLSIYKELLNAGIEFDLIYGALMWHTLFEHIDEIEGVILYVHSGGLMGNATMLERYRHKGLLSGRC